MSAALRLVEGSSMDKSKALDAALSQIERNFGKGSIMRLGKNDKSMEVETVSTGSLGLDIALGIGGLPRGRVVEIYGPESSGKTTLALHVIAEAQKKGGICAFIDAEHALDPVYARKLGVNVDDLLISQPDTGEQALEIADTLVRSGAVDVLVIDSVAALVPRAELEGEMGDSQPGLQARLMSQALRKLTASINRSNTHGDLHQPDPHEDRRDVRLARRPPPAAMRSNSTPRCASTSAASARSRSATRWSATRPASRWSRTSSRRRSSRSSSTSCMAKASPRRGELIDLGVKAGVVEKSGAWFSYDSQRIGQGRENAKAFLKDNPDIAAKIETAIRQNSGLIAEKILAGEEARRRRRRRGRVRVWNSK